MKFVTSLAFSPTSELCRLARACEDAGFAALGVSDHVIHPKQLRTPYPYTEDGAPRWEPFTDWPDPWVAVGAMAAVTREIRFLTSVYVLPMRNPFLVAKQVATAAVLSAGRVDFGIGTGWMEEEFDVMEQPFRRRGARMDEMLEVMRALWRGGWVEHRGEHYSFEALEMSPVPAAPIPIFVGGLSDRALRRAATADGWINDLHTSEELRGFVERLRNYRRDSPHSARPFSVVAAVSDAFDPDSYRRLEDIGVTHVQTVPWLFYGGDGSVDAKCEGIRRFGDDVITAMS